MIDTVEKIGFGGGCHWCTEAVFQSVNGVSSVEQGYIASKGAYQQLSEGVIVNYCSESVNLKTLIEIHLITHSSLQNHSMRDKYRSAIYTFSNLQKSKALDFLSGISEETGTQFITKVLDFDHFLSSRDEIKNYYFNDPSRPFCHKFINPKLTQLMRSHKNSLKMNQLNHLV